MNLLFLLISLSLSNLASASTPLDPLLGIRVALLASEHLLASPPLPSLSKNSNGEASVGGTLLFADINTAGTSAGTFYSGHFSGEAIGIGYKFTGSKGIGFFSYLSGTTMTGSSTLGSSSFDTSLNDFSTKAYVAMLGMSGRLLGADRSPLGVGYIAGLAGASFDSSFSISSTGDTSSYSYSSKPSVYGALVGGQADLRLGKLLINPYVFYFQELSKKCKSYATTDAADDGSSFDSVCYANSGPRTIGLSASFLAYGANIGYDNFLLNIYSQVVPDSALSSITLNSFSLSYRFKM